MQPKVKKEGPPFQMNTRHTVRKRPSGELSSSPLEEQEAKDLWKEVSNEYSNDAEDRDDDKDCETVQTQTETDIDEMFPEIADLLR
jgi:hypothetical protein